MNENDLLDVCIKMCSKNMYFWNANCNDFHGKRVFKKKKLKIIINVWIKKKTRPTFVELNKVGADFGKNICNMYDTLYDIILKWLNKYNIKLNSSEFFFVFESFSNTFKGKYNFYSIHRALTVELLPLTIVLLHCENNSTEFLNLSTFWHINIGM